MYIIMKQEMQKIDLPFYEEYFCLFFLFVVVLVKTASAEESVIQLEDITIVGEKSSHRSVSNLENYY